MRGALARKLSDDGFLRTLACAGNGDETPEATVLLAGDLERDILLVESRLLPRPGAHRIGLPDPLAFETRCSVRSKGSDGTSQSGHCHKRDERASPSGTFRSSD